MPQELMPNLYRLPVPLPDSPLKLLNSYVIKGGDRDLLIDTGFRRPECYESLTSQLAELGVDMARTDLLLTHLHADHCGLAPDLVTEGTRVFISRGDKPWLMRDWSREDWIASGERMVRFGFPRDTVEHAFHQSPAHSMAPSKDFQNYQPIDDGDEFSCGGYTLRAVCTPGHTPAHMCFWMETQKTMFTGDHVLFDISPNITTWTTVDDSLGDYLRSLKMIDAYDVQLALPGHRETGNFHARIAALLSPHEKRLAGCLEVLRENPGLTTYDVAGLMRWKIRCSSWEDFPMGQKWFAVGEAASHLLHLEACGLARGDRTDEVIRWYAQ